jgi:hypothetical protein
MLVYVRLPKHLSVLRLDKHERPVLLLQRNRQYLRAAVLTRVAVALGCIAAGVAIGGTAHSASPPWLLGSLALSAALVAVLQQTLP